MEKDLSVQQPRDIPMPALSWWEILREKMLLGLIMFLIILQSYVKNLPDFALKSTHPKLMKVSAYALKFVWQVQVFLYCRGLCDNFYSSIWKVNTSSSLLRIAISSQTNIWINICILLLRYSGILELECSLILSIFNEIYKTCIFFFCFPLYFQSYNPILHLFLTST